MAETYEYLIDLKNIPITNVAGLESALQSTGGSVFELDTNGDLMPSLVVVSDVGFETDSNGDLMPR